MILGFKNSPHIVPGDLKELAERLTGTGNFAGQQQTIQNAYYSIYIKDAEPHDDNIIRIIAENQDVADNDKIDSFTAQVTVDSNKTVRIHSLNDTTPPSAITNLAATNPTSNSITLTWTATGDDGNSGLTNNFDIRYSTSPITSQNWDTATQVSGEPIDKMSGTGCNFTVTGLSSGTTYYFAIKGADGVPNWSALSNVPSGATTQGPTVTTGSYSNVTGFSATISGSVTALGTATGIHRVR